MDTEMEQGPQSADMGMNFTESQQGIAILDRLHLQKDSGKFCDVVFRLHQHEYPAHRNVLAACSPYFESLFKIQLVQQETLTVNCRSREVFKVMLDYVYTGKVVINKSNVAELLLLANTYMIGKLKLYCSKYLETMLNITNCFLVKDLAEKCGLSALLKTAESFIMANIVNIVSGTEIQQFAEHRMQSFLSNKTLPITEDMKLRLICHWVRLHPKLRHRAMPRLLNAIQWKHVGTNSLDHIIRTDTLFVDSEWCVLHMLEKFQEQGMLYSMYFDQLRQLKEKLASATDEQPVPTYQQRSDVGDMAWEDNLITTFKQDSTAKSGDDSSVDEVEVGVSQHDNCAESAPSQQLGIAPDATESLSDPLNQIPSASQNATAKGRRKRKGTPVKMDVSSTKLCMSIKVEGATVSRDRGRPRKGGSTIALIQKQKSGKRKHKLQVTSKIQDEDSVNSDSALEVVVPTTKKKVKRSRRVKVEKLQCPHCEFVARGEEKLQQHMSRAHSKDTVFDCCMCDFTTSWNKEYYRHMKKHFPGPPFCCDFDACDYEVERIQALLIHRLVHTDERPHLCNICNQAFRTKNNLMTHNRLHTGEKPFVCAVCNRGFATKGTLEQHKVTHSDDRPYLCDTCGFSTKYQSHLIAHRRIHAGDVFHCQYQSCSYVTPKRSQLACHMRSHMSLRAHICSTCGRGFVEKSHLVRHERIHSDDKPFKCNLCEYTSTRRDKLKEHNGKYHGETATAVVPYKPRRPRKQTFDPTCFPGTNQAGAEAKLKLQMEAADEQHEKDVKGLLKRRYTRSPGGKRNQPPPQERPNTPPGVRLLSTRPPLVFTDPVTSGQSGVQVASPGSVQQATIGSQTQLEPVVTENGAQSVPTITPSQSTVDMEAIGSLTEDARLQLMLPGVQPVGVSHQGPLAAAIQQGGLTVQIPGTGVPPPLLIATSSLQHHRQSAEFSGLHTFIL